MVLLGSYLTILTGKTIPKPVSSRIVESIRSVKIIQNLEKTYFEVIVSAGRGKKDILGIPVEYTTSLKEFNRIILVAILGVRPHVLVDGIIKRIQYTPSYITGQSSYTVTGADISDALDMEQVSKTYPKQNEATILKTITKNPKYAQYRIVDKPPIKPTPVPSDLIITPTQANVTDYQYLKAIAQRRGYIFTIEPGGIPGTNIAYMGPAVDEKLKFTPFKPINFNMGVFTNTSNNISFDYDSSKFANQIGYYLDTDRHVILPIQTFGSQRPPLSLKPAGITNMTENRKEKFISKNATNYIEAIEEAQALTELGTDLLNAEVQVDTFRYGQILRPRRFVPVTGAGIDYSGLYYIKQVIHEIQPGKGYTQSITISRDGKGSNISTVIQP